MIKAIAIDDEPLALEIIKTHCSAIDFINLTNTFTSHTKAIKYLNKNNVDLIFLDIQISEVNGIDIYKSLKKEIKVIFTTAYSHYAVEGFNVNASDYLLKPFSLERFLVSVNKVKKEIETNFLKEEKTHLAIKADYKLHNILFKEILFIEALDDYIGINLSNGTKIVARYTMKNILTKLPPTEFKRTHRSFIVQLKKIKSIFKDTLKIEDFVIPISATYKQEIVKNLNI
ncbi:LytTR family DNA-binding domain-containing protein [uncultured Polaribacter sp.]|uniref:LytR/AlgR family response regulator transcription factor n=1 Tax=uncultured Polaribacter sp. TaxID=174711 RepID=UPI0026368ADC|nr:LytTR family DNA-binding domain-containing protein [uncultured Polaribacter sp.]